MPSPAFSPTGRKLPARAEEVFIEILRSAGLDTAQVSKHCSDTHYVFDVAPSSIADKRAFVAAARSHEAVTRFLGPPLDPAYHIEIPREALAPEP